MQSYEFKKGIQLLSLFAIHVHTNESVRKLHFHAFVEMCPKHSPSAWYHTLPSSCPRHRIYTQYSRNNKRNDCYFLHPKHFIQMDITIKHAHVFWYTKLKISTLPEPQFACSFSCFLEKGKIMFFPLLKKLLVKDVFVTNSIKNEYCQFREK